MIPLRRIVKRKENRKIYFTRIPVMNLIGLESTTTWRGIKTLSVSNITNLDFLQDHMKESQKSRKDII